jgi:hypothetical protein
MQSIEANDEHSKTVDFTPDGIHAYGNGVDVSMDEHVMAAGFEEINVRIHKDAKQLVLRLPLQDNGDAFSEGEMTMFIDPRQHALVIRAWLPGEGIWRTTIELAPEN